MHIVLKTGLGLRDKHRPLRKGEVTVTPQARLQADKPTNSLLAQARPTDDHHRSSVV